MRHLSLVAAGRVIKHFIGALLLAWLRAFRAGFIAGLLAILGVEIGAIIVTHHFPPPGIAHVVAGALAIALGFGVAVTVVADEIIAGVVEAIRLLLGEAEAGVRQAARIAEREVGDVRGAALRLTGLDTLMSRFAQRDVPNPDLAPDAPSRPVPARSPTMSTAAILAALAAVPAGAAVVAAARQSHSSTPAHAPAADIVDATLPAPPPTPTVLPAPPAAGDVTATLPPAILAPALPTAINQPTDVAAAFGSAAPVTVPLDPHDRTAASLDLSASTSAWPQGPQEAERDAPSQSPTLPAPARPPATSAPPAQAAPPTIPLAASPSAMAAASTAPAEVAAGAPGAASPPVAAPASGALAEPAEWHLVDVPPPSPLLWHDPAHGGLELEHEDAGAGIQPVDVFGALPSTAPPVAPADAPPASADQLHAAPATRPLFPRGNIWDHITNVVAGKLASPFAAAEDLPEGAPDADPPPEDATPTA